MKKFLINIIIFGICLFITDISVGYISIFLRKNAKGGSTAHNYYMANNSNDDIIILGSSRATHHYIPQIIEDSLNISCYNFGEEGNGIILAYGRFLMSTKNHKPKLIIYEVTPEYDYGDGQTNDKYLRYLRQYYSEKGVKEIINKVIDSKEQIKMMSQMYQNNSMLLPALIDNIIYRDNNMGYSPMNGTMDIIDTIKHFKIRKTDIIKKTLFEEFVLDVNNMNIPLVMFVSPKYKVKDSINYNYAKSICNKYNVPFHNFLEDKRFSDNHIYFNDREHLNNKGAMAYTNMLIPIIRKYLDTNN